MGSSGSTPVSEPPPTPPTLEEIKPVLKKQLTDNARDLLRNDFGIADDTDNLETLLNKLAVNKFKQTYGYDFTQGMSEGGVAEVNPPGHLGIAGTAAKMCDVAPPVDTQVKAYLESGVFSNILLPKYMVADAVNDLSNVASTIVARDTERQWRYTAYSRLSDAKIIDKAKSLPSDAKVEDKDNALPSDAKVEDKGNSLPSDSKVDDKKKDISPLKVEDPDNYMCNSILVYCNGSLIEDGIRAELAFIYYVGVYYKVASETKATRDKIKRSAYSGAQILANRIAPTPTPTTDGFLQAALETYAKDRFKSEFNFEYASTPPDSFQAKGTSAFVVHNSKLCCVADTKADGLEKYIQNEVYSGINIPLKSVRDEAMKDTFTQFKSIMDTASTESWNPTRLDKTYIPANPLNNPIRQTGLIVSWYDHKTTDKGVGISVTYIYFITMFYECQNAKQELAGQLFKVLCNNLRRHIKDDQSIGDFTDSTKLEEFMLSYSTQEFAKRLGFQFLPDNLTPSKSTPPNIKSGGKVQRYQEILNLENYPLKKEELQNWMNNNLFRRTDKKFPLFARGPIYDEIIDRMLYYGGPETAKDNNGWAISEFTREYYDTTEKGEDIQQFGLFLYALGDMTLNRVDGTGQEGVSIKRFLVYYLGVFCSYDASASEWS